MQIMSASPTPSESPTPSTTPSVTLTTTVSASVSPTASPCAAGWSFFSDSDGFEGQASCLKVTGTATFDWMTAMAACPMNSHLLTMAGTSPGSGLFVFSRSVSTSSFWVGASQFGAAVAVNRDWAWIDGTSATVNLNCDVVNNNTACGLWREFSPGYVDPFHYQLYALFFTFCDVCAVTMVALRIMKKISLAFDPQAWMTLVGHSLTSACVRWRCRPCVPAAGPSTLMLMAPKARHHACGCPLLQLRHGLPQARAARQAGICSQ
jgi:hypothetical protein